MLPLTMHYNWHSMIHRRFCPSTKQYVRSQRKVIGCKLMYTYACSLIGQGTLAIKSENVSSIELAQKTRKTDSPLWPWGLGLTSHVYSCTCMHLSMSVCMQTSLNMIATSAASGESMAKIPGDLVNGDLVGKALQIDSSEDEAPQGAAMEPESKRRIKGKTRPVPPSAAQLLKRSPSKAHIDLKSSGAAESSVGDNVEPPKKICKRTTEVPRWPPRRPQTTHQSLTDFVKDFCSQSRVPSGYPEGQ